VSPRLPQRFRLNIASSYLRVLAAAGVSVITTPILITGLGKEAFGIWVIVGSLSVYRTLLQFGLGQATPRYVAESASRDDAEEMRSSIATSFWLLLVPSGLALVIGLGLVVSFDALFEIPGDLQDQARLLLLIMVFDFALAIPADAFSGTLIGLQRYDLLNWTVIVVVVAQAVGWVVVVLAGGGLVPLGIVTISVSLAGQLWRYLLARGLVAGMTLSLSAFKRSLVRPFTRFSAWLAVEDVAVLVIARTDTLIVGLVIGLEAAAVYAVGQKLVALAAQAAGPLSALFFPHAADLTARSDSEGLRASVWLGTRLALAVAMPIGLIAAVLAGPILDVWVGSGFEEAVPVVVLLVAATLISSSIDTGAVMLQGSGNAKGPGLIAGAEATLNLGLTLLLAHLIGISGVALATLLAAVTLNLLVLFPYFCRKFGIRLREFVGALVVAQIPAVAAALLVGWAVTRADLDSLPEVAIAAALVGGAYVAVFAFSGLSGAERRGLRKRIRDLSPRPSEA
jgi:O-antigen/teichoic acid export membrane protein